MAKSTSVVLCPLTSHMVEVSPIRITLISDKRNGLNQTSQIMTDKVITVTRSRIGKVIGKVDDETMLRMNRALAFVLGLGQ